MPRGGTLEFHEWAHHSWWLAAAGTAQASKINASFTVTDLERLAWSPSWRCEQLEERWRRLTGPDGRQGTHDFPRQSCPSNEISKFKGD